MKVGKRLIKMKIMREVQLHQVNLEMQEEVGSDYTESILAKIGRRFGTSDDPFRFGDEPPPGHQFSDEVINTTPFFLMVLLQGTLESIGVASDDPAMLSAQSSESFDRDDSGAVRTIVDPRSKITGRRDPELMTLENIEQRS